MTGAEDRELLAHAIWTTGRTRAVDRYPLADALMPVVEAIARRRAAEELRAAAECVRRSGGGLDPHQFIAGHLDDHAAVLTDTEETL